MRSYGKRFLDVKIPDPRPPMVEQHPREEFSLASPTHCRYNPSISGVASPVLEGDSDDEALSDGEEYDFPCGPCVNDLRTKGEHACAPGANRASPTPNFVVPSSTSKPFRLRVKPSRVSGREEPNVSGPECILHGLVALGLQLPVSP
ncbi:hypothetical protein C2857_003639 [Epichloe festucae Fl1]|uniref:Uncharacterized protein n=1 Tax=Epichloe festucae (strain Fl1) TaxID=877507 RepID=A0A7U3Q2A4_EPIFF|nr:hypothetical protein C2857_003639 [Epichloe festucae Fl1]